MSSPLTPQQCDDATAYLIEFGKLGNTRPVPPTVIEATNRDQLADAITRHAVPYLAPVLAAMGRPELADCIFHPVGDLSGGHFLWLDFQSGRGARFCPTRITAGRTPDDDQICGDFNDGDWCELEPGHEGHHRADTAEWAQQPPAPVSV